MTLKTLLVCGFDTGTGATTVAEACAQLLRLQGETVRICSIGPSVGGSSVRPDHLDTWLLGPQLLAYLLECANSCSVLILDASQPLSGSSGAAAGSLSIAAAAAQVCASVVLVTEERNPSALLSQYQAASSLLPDQAKALVVNKTKPGECSLSSLQEQLKECNLLGCVPQVEGSSVNSSYATQQQSVSNHVADWLDQALLCSLLASSNLEVPTSVHIEPTLPSISIAVAQDEAFKPIYQDNLRLLEHLGCQLVPFSPLVDATLPHGVSGVYLAGTDVEDYCAELASNTAMLLSIRTFCLAGGVVLAEGSAISYLCQSVQDALQRPYSAVGILPFRARVVPGKPQQGFVDVEVLPGCPLLSVGTTLRGSFFSRVELVEERVVKGLQAVASSASPTSSAAGSAPSSEPGSTSSSSYSFCYQAVMQPACSANPNANSQASTTTHQTHTNSLLSAPCGMHHTNPVLEGYCVHHVMASSIFLYLPGNPQAAAELIRACSQTDLEAVQTAIEAAHEAAKQVCLAATAPKEEQPSQRPSYVGNFASSFKIEATSSTAPATSDHSANGGQLSSQPSFEFWKSWHPPQSYAPLTNGSTTSLTVSTAHQLPNGNSQLHGTTPHLTKNPGSPLPTASSPNLSTEKSAASVHSTTSQTSPPLHRPASHSSYGQLPVTRSSVDTAAPQRPGQPYILAKMYPGSAQHMPSGVADPIVSFCPGAVEAIVAMGLGGRLVGISSSCSYPADVKTGRVVMCHDRVQAMMEQSTAATPPSAPTPGTSSSWSGSAPVSLAAAALSSMRNAAAPSSRSNSCADLVALVAKRQQQEQQLVQQLRLQGDSRYWIDEAALSSEQPKLVALPDLSSLHMVDQQALKRALYTSGLVWQEPGNTAVVHGSVSNLSQLMDWLLELGMAAGTPQPAIALVERLQGRLKKLAAACMGGLRQAAGKRPRVLVLESASPLVPVTRWIPEVLELIGAPCEVMHAPGQDLTWQDVRQYAPQVLVIVNQPDNQQLNQLPELAGMPGWWYLPAVRHAQVFCLNAGYVSHAGPRLVDAAEALGRAVWPDAVTKPAAADVLLKVSLNENQRCRHSSLPSYFVPWT